MNINTDYNKFGENELKKDILVLYCKTKCHAIEDIYLKIAQAPEVDFPSWLKKNHRTLRSEMNDPETLDALTTLIYLYNDVGATPTLHEIINSFDSDTRYMGRIPVIKAMAGLLDGSFNILTPFASIIDVINRGIQHDMPQNVDMISDDLLTIQDAFYSGGDGKLDVGTIKTNRSNITQKRKNMFLLLLDRFSTELSAIAASQNLPEFSKALTTGILALPAPLGIGKYIDIGNLGRNQAALAKKLAGYILNYPDEKYFRQHHDLINIEALSSSGGMTKEDAYRFKEVFETNKNVTDLAGVTEGLSGAGVTEGVDEPLLPEGSIPNDSRMDPEYLIILSATFYWMQQRTKASPSVFI